MSTSSLSKKKKKTKRGKDKDTTTPSSAMAPGDPFPPSTPPILTHTASSSPSLKRYKSKFSRKKKKKAKRRRTDGEAGAGTEAAEPITSPRVALPSPPSITPLDDTLCTKSAQLSSIDEPCLRLFIDSVRITPPFNTRSLSFELSAPSLRYESEVKSVDGGDDVTIKWTSLDVRYDCADVRSLSNILTLRVRSTDKRGAKLRGARVHGMEELFSLSSVISKHGHGRQVLKFDCYETEDTLDVRRGASRCIVYLHVRVHAWPMLAVTLVDVRELLVKVSSDRFSSHYDDLMNSIDELNGLIRSSLLFNKSHWTTLINQSFVALLEAAIVNAARHNVGLRKVDAATNITPDNVESDAAMESFVGTFNQIYAWTPRSALEFVLQFLAALCDGNDAVKRALVRADLLVSLTRLLRILHAETRFNAMRFILNCARPFFKWPAYQRTLVTCGFMHELLTVIARRSIHTKLQITAYEMLMQLQERHADALIDTGLVSYVVSGVRSGGPEVRRRALAFVFNFSMEHRHELMAAGLMPIIVQYLDTESTSTYDDKISCLDMLCRDDTNVEECLENGLLANIDAWLELRGGDYECSALSVHPELDAERREVRTRNEVALHNIQERCLRVLHNVCVRGFADCVLLEDRAGLLVRLMDDSHASVSMAALDVCAGYAASKSGVSSLINAGFFDAAVRLCVRLPAPDCARVFLCLDYFEANLLIVLRFLDTLLLLLDRQVASTFRSAMHRSASPVYSVCKQIFRNLRESEYPEQVVDSDDGSYNVVDDVYDNDVNAATGSDGGGPSPVAGNVPAKIVPDLESDVSHCARSLAIVDFLRRHFSTAQLRSASAHVRFISTVLIVDSREAVRPLVSAILADLPDPNESKLMTFTLCALFFISVYPSTDPRRKERDSLKLECDHGATLSARDRDFDAYQCLAVAYEFSFRECRYEHGLELFGALCAEMRENPVLNSCLYERPLIYAVLSCIVNVAYGFHERCQLAEEYVLRSADVEDRVLVGYLATALCEHTEYLFCMHRIVLSHRSGERRIVLPDGASWKSILLCWMDTHCTMLDFTCEETEVAEVEVAGTRFRSIVGHSWMFGMLMVALRCFDASTTVTVWKSLTLLNRIDDEHWSTVKTCLLPEPEYGLMPEIMNVADPHFGATLYTANWFEARLACLETSYEATFGKSNPSHTRDFSAMEVGVSDDLLREMLESDLPETLFAPHDRVWLYVLKLALMCTARMMDVVNVLHLALAGENGCQVGDTFGMWAPFDASHEFDGRCVCCSLVDWNHEDFQPYDYDVEREWARDFLNGFLSLMLAASTPSSIDSLQSTPFNGFFLVESRVSIRRCTLLEVFGQISAALSSLHDAMFVGDAALDVARMALLEARLCLGVHWTSLRVAVREFYTHSPALIALALIDSDDAPYEGVAAGLLSKLEAMSAKGFDAASPTVVGTPIVLKLRSMMCCSDTLDNVLFFRQVALSLPSMRPRTMDRLLIQMGAGVAVARGNSRALLDCGVLESLWIALSISLGVDVDKEPAPESVFVDTWLYALFVVARDRFFDALTIKMPNLRSAFAAMNIDAGAAGFFTLAPIILRRVLQEDVCTSPATNLALATCFDYFPRHTWSALLLAVDEVERVARDSVAVDFEKCLCRVLAWARHGFVQSVSGFGCAYGLISNYKNPVALNAFGRAYHSWGRLGAVVVSLVPNSWVTHVRSELNDYEIDKNAESRSIATFAFDEMITSLEQLPTAMQTYEYVFGALKRGTELETAIDGKAGYCKRARHIPFSLADEDSEWFFVENTFKYVEIGGSEGAKLEAVWRTQTYVADTHIEVTLMDGTIISAVFLDVNDVVIVDSQFLGTNNCVYSNILVRGRQCVRVPPLVDLQALNAHDCVTPPMSCHPVALMRDGYDPPYTEAFADVVIDPPVRASFLVLQFLPRMPYERTSQLSLGPTYAKRTFVVEGTLTRRRPRVVPFHISVPFVPDRDEHEMHATSHVNADEFDWRRTLTARQRATLIPLYGFLPRIRCVSTDVRKVFSGPSYYSAEFFHDVPVVCVCGSGKTLKMCCSVYTWKVPYTSGVWRAAPPFGEDSTDDKVEDGENNSFYSSDVRDLMPLLWVSSVGMHCWKKLASVTWNVMDSKMLLARSYPMNSMMPLRRYFRRNRDGMGSTLLGHDTFNLMLSLAHLIERIDGTVLWSRIPSEQLCFDEKLLVTDATLKALLATFSEAWERSRVEPAGVVGAYVVEVAESYAEMRYEHSLFLPCKVGDVLVVSKECDDMVDGVVFAWHYDEVREREALVQRGDDTLNSSLVYPFFHTYTLTTIMDTWPCVNPIIMDPGGSLLVESSEQLTQPRSSMHYGAVFLVDSAQWPRYWDARVPDKLAEHACALFDGEDSAYDRETLRTLYDICMPEHLAGFVEYEKTVILWVNSLACDDYDDWASLHAMQLLRCLLDGGVTHVHVHDSTTSGLSYAQLFRRVFEHMFCVDGRTVPTITELRWVSDNDNVGSVDAEILNALRRSRVMRPRYWHAIVGLVPSMYLRVLREISDVVVTSTDDGAEVTASAGTVRTVRHDDESGERIFDICDMTMPANDGEEEEIMMDDSIVECLRKLKCTRLVTGTDFRRQHYVYCKTCFHGLNAGICLSCAVRCHRHHVISRTIRSGRFFCDCCDVYACEAMDEHAAVSPTFVPQHIDQLCKRSVMTVPWKKFNGSSAWLSRVRSLSGVEVANASGADRFVYYVHRGIFDLLMAAREHDRLLPFREVKPAFKARDAVCDENKYVEPRSMFSLLPVTRDDGEEANEWPAFECTTMYWGYPTCENQFDESHWCGHKCAARFDAQLRVGRQTVFHVDAERARLARSLDADGNRWVVPASESVAILLDRMQKQRILRGPMTRGCGECAESAVRRHEEFLVYREEMVLKTVDEEKFAYVVTNKWLTYWKAWLYGGMSLSELSRIKIFVGEMLNTNAKGTKYVRVKALKLRNLDYVLVSARVWTLLKERYKHDFEVRVVLSDTTTVLKLSPEIKLEVAVAPDID